MGEPCYGLPMVDYRHARDIPDDVFIAAVKETMRLRGEAEAYGHPASWATRWDLAQVLGGTPENIGTHAATDDVPGVPPKIILAKAKRLIKRGKIDGCPCGCRGDFRIPTTQSSWTHTTNARAEVLVLSIGNKIIDYVMLPVDENGMPT